MDLQVKKLKVNSLTGPYHHPKAETNYKFSELRERSKKTYFEMYCFKPNFLKR